MGSRAAIALAIAAAVTLYVTAIPGGNDYRVLFGSWRASGIGLALLFCLAAIGCWLGGRSRRALMTYVFAGMLAGALLALLELAGLTGLVSYAELMGNTRQLETNDLGAHATPHLDVRGSTTQDTATGWGLPNEAIDFHYQTDRYGFRNAHDLGSAEIYLLGDSVVVGALVPFEATVTAALGRATDRSAMTVALIGLSPQEEIEAFGAAALPVAGRLVLHFIFEGNDLLDSRRYRDGGRAPALERGDWLRSRSFTDNAIRALQRLTQRVSGLARKRVCTLDGQTYTFRWAHGSYRGIDDEQPILLDLLEDFAGQIRAEGGLYAVVLVPTKLRVMGPHCDEWPAENDVEGIIDANPVRATLHAWSESRDIPLIDLTDALRASTRDGSPPWFWGDTHWNARGHAVAAEVIAAAPVTRELLAEPRILRLSSN